MSILDCHDQQTTLATLSAAVGVAPRTLVAALRNFDDAVLENCEDDPAMVMPRKVLGSVGVDITSVPLAGAHYFHGTRSTNPADFHRDGILPLNLVVERIWTTLHELLRGDCSSDEWAAFRRSVEKDGGGHDGDLYRLKTRGRLHHGPHAVLVRDILLDASANGWHDYLACPEIVQDIARCYGSGLEARFRAASVPCIVTFRRTDIDAPRAIATACWYLHGDGRTNITIDGYMGEGLDVPPEDVVGVEVVR
jgi:hypothetical protein